jgi:hypothetical protein
VPTPAVRNLIREGKTHQIYSAIQTSGSIGMQTMDADLARLVRAGTITRALAEQRSAVPEELKRMLGGGRREDDGSGSLGGGGDSSYSNGNSGAYAPAGQNTIWWDEKTGQPMASPYMPQGMPQGQTAPPMEIARPLPAGPKAMVGQPAPEVQVGGEAECPPAHFQKLLLQGFPRAFHGSS